MYKNFIRKYSLQPWRSSLWLFSLWPLFLLISQKYLVLYDIFLGPRRRRLDRGVAIGGCFFVAALLFSLVTLTLKYNSYSLSHFLAYIVFLVYSLVIASFISNISLFNSLLHILTRLNIFSLILIYLVYFLDLDLSSYRGLNFIRGTDGEIHRFFVETSSLLLTSRYYLVRNKVLRLLFWFSTLFYFVFIAKITLLILLFIGMELSKYFRKYPFMTFAFVVTTIVIFYLFGFYVYFVREDLILSVLFKIEQLNVILSSFNLSHLYLGSGFGFYISELVTDYSQPYQIEMQLPMLVLQLGLFNVFLFVMGFYFLFKSILVKRGAFAGLFLFITIGFINPWLFLPVWFISVAIYTNLLLNDKDNCIGVHA